jgi:hypothetical protein
VIEPSSESLSLILQLANLPDVSKLPGVKNNPSLFGIAKTTCPS